MHRFIKNRQLLTNVISVLCIFTILFTSVFHPSGRIDQSVKAEEPQATQSNSATQITVSGPSNVRVNTWNGNLYLPVSLLTIPGRGIPIELSLSYNSSWHDVNQNFGNGWQLSYNMFYVRTDGGDIVVVWEDGHADTYVKNGGDFISPLDVHDSLEEYMPGSYRLRTKEGMEYYFDSPIHKRVGKIQDPNGNVLVFNYDADLLLTTITDASGRQVTFSYTNGNLTQITDTNTTPSRNIYLHYSSSGDNLIGITNPLGDLTQYGYDSEHYLKSITDPLGNPATTITYLNGAVSNISQSTMAKSFSYDTTTRKTTMTDTVAGGNRVTYFIYDESGRIAQMDRVKDGQGNVASQKFLWDDNNNLTEFTDENDHITTYTYDALGNLETITDPLGHVTTYTYELAYNKVTSVQDANNQTTTYEYDANGNLERVIDPLNNDTVYTYDANGLPITIRDANSHTTTYDYNLQGDLISIEDPLGNITEYSYDNVGNRLTTTDANSHTVTYEYDAYDNLTKIIDPLNNQTTYDYDANGNLVTSTDPENNTTSYEYDALNRLERVIDALGHQTTYAYDQVGNLKTILDAEGHTTTFTYNLLDQLINEADPMGNTTRYTLDGTGNILTRVDANGITTQYNYDDANRLETIDYPGSDDVTYVYDPVGNVTEMSNAEVTVSQSFDALNRLTGANVATGGFSKNTSYTYDDVGNRATMTDPDSGVTTYTYDDANRLISLTNPSAQTTLFTYDNASRLTQKDLANGTYATYVYDNADRLVSVAHNNSTDTTLMSFAYAYDDAGNRLSMTEANGDITTYAYDDIYQLTAANYPDGSSEAFTYDAVGNRTRLIDSSGTINYSYDDANRLLSAGNVSFGWDNNGNQTSKTENNTTTTYDYDFENRLTDVTFPDATANKFAYYPDGRRLSVTDRSGIKIQFVYDFENVLIELNNAGNTMTHYTSLGIDDWISLRQGMETYYYHKDGLNSIIGLTDFNQTPVATYQYYAYGSQSNSSGNINNPYLFTGRRIDTEADLYYYRARHYDGMVGRFLQKDPMGFIDGSNLYRYARNNPAIFLDPLGLFSDRDGDGVPDNRDIQPDNPDSPQPSDRRNDRDGDGVPDYRDIQPDNPDSPQPSDRRNDRDGDGVPDYRDIQPDNPDSPQPSDRRNDRDGDGIPDNRDIQPDNPNSPRPSNGGGSSGGGYGGGGSGHSGGSGSGGGGGAGGESRPLPVSSAFLNTSEMSSLSEQLVESSDPIVELVDVFPSSGPTGTQATPVTPSFPLGGATNAVDAAAVDYVSQSNGRVKATVFGTTTTTDPYEHDYGICSRFQNYALESMAPVALPDIIPQATETPWFWYNAMTKDDLVEETFIIAVFVNESEKTFTVDSYWVGGNYSPPPGLDYDYILNLQIWASDSGEAYKLLQRMLSNLAGFGSGWTVDFANTTQPTMPSVVIKTAAVAGDKILMTVQSWLPNARNVSFTGTYRNPNDSTTNIPFDIPVNLSPGFNSFELDLGIILDAVVQVEVDGFLDKVYVGSGFWFAFNDGQDSLNSMEQTVCEEPTSYGDKALIVPGCRAMTGAITQSDGYIGLGVTINPNGRAIDVSQHGALTFRAKGDGRSYHLKVETDSVTDGDFHEIVFTAPNGEWRQFIIPLTAFKQRFGNNPVSFTGSDVKALIWIAEGSLPASNVHLEIDQVAFFSSSVISSVDSLTTTNDVYSPFPVIATITDDSNIVNSTLYYSTDDGDTYSSTVMRDMSGDTFSGQIPGQPMGTHVSYYVETIDDEGNGATHPIDAPHMTQHYRTEWYSSKLVENFYDKGTTNLLGGDAGVTEVGGTGTAVYTNGSMCINYSITDPGGYVVYFSLLRGLNITSYRSLSFDIKGAVGGELAKVGLNDGNVEPKIEVSEHLPKGITTNWQTVRIPIEAFTEQITDWSQMHSFSLAFEDSIGSGDGSVCIDNVRFEPDALPLALDNFNDQDYQNGVGLNHDTDVGNGGVLSAMYDTTNAFGNTGAGLSLTYNVPINGYGAWHTGLNTDVSDYEKLVFMAKGISGGETFHIWLQGGGVSKWVEVTDYANITTNWTRVEIPLQVFADQGVDLSQLALFKIGFEWVPMNGTVYIDDIRFELPPSPQITAVFPTTMLPGIPTQITISGNNFRMTPTVAMNYHLLTDVTLVNSTTITAVVPSDIASGAHTIQIVQPNMQAATKGDVFQVPYTIYLPGILNN